MCVYKTHTLGMAMSICARGGAGGALDTEK